MGNCTTVGCRKGQECLNCISPVVPNTIYPSTIFYPSSTKEEKTVKIPELYPENLDTLKHIMDKLDLFTHIKGVFDIEIRVRIDNVDIWAVIGYGESGDPCLLRFDPK